MPVIFQLEEKPKFKSVTVCGVEIPLYGDITVDEAIAEEKAMATEADQTAISSTEWAIFRVAAWLSVRLGIDKAEIMAQLKQSKALVDELWAVFYAERERKTDNYELEESEVGKGKNQSQSKASKTIGTPSISSSQVADLQQNSLVVLGGSISA
jgi:hypothetical protein